jgi:mannose-6-phosphate isomerase-like protein (cupin superfamily)
MAVEFVPLTDSFREWTRTREQIRQEGAVGSLCRGIEIETHGVRTRIIAWPGNGLQTQSLHVLTLSPGESSASYAFPSSEELMLCLKGAGEITMRGQRIEIMPGDLAYFPEGLTHQIWNAAAAERISFWCRRYPSRPCTSMDPVAIMTWIDAAGTSTGSRPTNALHAR